MNRPVRSPSSKSGPGHIRLLTWLVASTLVGEVAQAASECSGTPTAYAISTATTAQVNLRCTDDSLSVTSTGSISSASAVYMANAISNGDIRVGGAINYTGSGIAIASSTLDELVISGTGSLTRVAPETPSFGYPYAISLSNAQLRRLEIAGQVTPEGSGLLIQSSTITGELVNASTGVIAPAADGFADSAISLSDGSRVEKLTNHGMLKGSSYGILFTGETGAEISAGLLNTGTITAGSTGIKLNGTPGHRIAGGLINEGVIHGDENGIEVESASYSIDGVAPPQISGGLINRGTISGGYMAIYGQDDGSLDHIDIEGTRARLIGDVYTPYTDLNIRTGAVFSVENAMEVHTLTVEPGARLNLSAAPSSSGELSEGLRVNQDFFNNGTVAVGSSTLARLNADYHQSRDARYEVGVAGMNTNGILAINRGTATFASGTGLHVVVAPSAELEVGGKVRNVLAGSRLVFEGGLASVKVTDNSVKYKFGLSAHSLFEAAPRANEQPTVLASTPEFLTIEDGVEIMTMAGIDLLVMKDDAPFVTSLGSGGAGVRSLAGMLDQLSSDGIPAGLESLVNQLRELPADQLAQNLSQLVPTLHAAGQQATLGAIRAISTQIQGRLESVRSGQSAGNSLTERFAWVRAFGSTADQDNQGSIAGFRSRSHGLVVGADALVNPDWRAGLAFTYARSDLDSVGASASSQLDVNTYQLAHYGSYALDARTDISYQLDVGLNQNKGKRFITLTSQQADSDYDSVNVHAGVGVSRQWQLGEASKVSPGVRLDYSRIRTQAYTETGAGNLSLNVGSDRQEELVLAAELRGVHALSASTRLDGFVSAGYNFSDRAATSTSAFVGGGTTFASAGLKSAPWLYRAGFGLLHTLGNLEYNARFDLEHRDSGFLNQTVSLRVRWAF